MKALRSAAPAAPSCQLSLHMLVQGGMHMWIDMHMDTIVHIGTSLHGALEMGACTCAEWGPERGVGGLQELWTGRICTRDAGEGLLRSGIIIKYKYFSKSLINSQSSRF